MTASSSSAKFEVTKFDGTGNFGLWQQRVKDLLAQQGMLKALSDKKPEEMKKVDWDELQARTVATIRLCLSDDVVYHVVEVESAAEVWAKLEKRYMAKSLTNKLHLRQKLYGLRMQEGSDLTQHLNTFNQVMVDFGKLDLKLEDVDKAMILLCSLPSSYEHVKTTLTCGRETITLEETMSALVSHNQRRMADQENSQADGLVAYKGKDHEDRGRRQNRQHGGKRGGRSKSKKRVQCYKCQQFGHMRRECPNRKSSGGAGNSGGNNNKTDVASSSVNVAEFDSESSGNMLVVSNTSLTDVWIVDSGYSYHMTSNRH